MMWVKYLANGYHWMVLQQGPQFLSALLPCPVGVIDNKSGMQRVSMALFILSFNSDWRPGLCAASGPLAASGAGAEMSPEDPCPLHSAHIGTVLSLGRGWQHQKGKKKSRCPKFQPPEGRFLPFAHLSWERSCDSGYVSYDHR